MCVGVQRGTPPPYAFACNTPINFIFLRFYVWESLQLSLQRYRKCSGTPVCNSIGNLWGGMWGILYIFNPGDSVLLYRYASNLSSQKIDNKFA